MIALNIAMAANPIVLAVGAAAVGAFALYKLTSSNVSSAKNVASSVASNFDAKTSSVYQAGALTPYDSQRTLAPATTANRGVMVQVNTGVGDPVKIGKEVNDVLNAYFRRGK
jgi:hypothetical protein